MALFTSHTGQHALYDRETIRKVGLQAAKDDPQNVWVQADGHELLHIAKSFLNLPMPKNAIVVRWHGDMAKFILTNYEEYNADSDLG